MSIQRLIVIADGHDLVTLIRVLLDQGVKPSRVFVSQDADSPALRAMGVIADLPSGRLNVTAAVAGMGCEVGCAGCSKCRIP